MKVTLREVAMVRNHLTTGAVSISGSMNSMPHSSPVLFERVRPRPV